MGRNSRRYRNSDPPLAHTQLSLYHRFNFIGLS